MTKEMKKETLTRCDVFLVTEQQVFIKEKAFNEMAVMKNNADILFLKCDISDKALTL